ncbi:integrase arm-type DNA-binding domain-containing protein [Thiothrix lacustris]|uniref:Integrase arm-type DNA-binding domain-containing protein n=1 Tax=Thiothrix lacustris TaxID=525917 RepID=A0ABY9MQJ2_9GAMM|nr:integrase arm-type DNA-binding domain-containing protein [Thiothrix lacustris]WML90867.1 integrase arm-type DNA-binding domain-containing protein [Thiothrix lacustris]
MPSNKLTIKEIEHSKPKDKPYKLSDGGGLYLLINPKGSMYWRWKYRIQGREKLLAIGVYPDVSLKEAREVMHEARKRLDQGIDPSLTKKLQALAPGADTFKAVALEWIERHLKNKSASHYARTVGYLERDVFPFLGARPVGAIKPPELIPIIDRIQKRVVRDSHLRTLQVIGQILRYAIATGRREDADPTPSLKGLFPPKEAATHFPAITDPVEVGRLMRAISHYSGNMITKAALELSSIVMMRPGALIRAEWGEIDFDAATWTIEAERMKNPMQVKKANREEDRHIIPLPAQALAILQGLLPLTGHSCYVFLSPAIRSKKHGEYHKPMSAETVNKAVQRMGFAGEMTGHGFRSMASTLLNDARRPDGSRMWDSDAIERQLSHKDRNQIRSAYNRGQYLDERRRMLQWWADYLDRLKEGGKVIPIRASVTA